jgi:hypothetical protein
VPDDADPAVEAVDAERARRAGAAELRGGAGRVGLRPLADLDVIDGVAGADADVSERSLERALEGEAQLLGDLQRPVRLDVDGDVGSGEGELLGAGRWGAEQEQDERDEDDSASEAPSVRTRRPGPPAGRRPSRGRAWV